MWSRPDVVRLLLTFASSLAGMVVVLLIFLFALGYTKDKDQATVVQGIASTGIAMIGTLVGFVSGHSAGSAGKERSDERAEKATEQATTAKQRSTAMEAMAPDVVNQARTAFPDLFK